MDRNDHFRENDFSKNQTHGFDEFLSDLIESDQLEGKANGIAKFLRDKGFSALSKKQRYIIDQCIIRPYEAFQCIRCSEAIGWDRVLEESQSGEPKCEYCQYSYDKLMRD